ncbi:hypothetical protein CHS0354_008841 [Potamilus streckersoni]|uniref:Solute carrier organic anion transporter family member n=1 Tax=Potamilus streckersoni TaxID=2493646 RepID=A0AAE0SUB4_9BIVA|nr:hypothetical protein CHS0354_008841 [Potamilus streckersoni]
MEVDANNDNNGKPVKDSESELDVRCGYGKCKPKWLQKLNNPQMLLSLLCIFAFVQAFVVSGLINVNTSTLERRFHLPSSRVGAISSAYDLTAAIIGVFAGFYGSRRNKARWLSFSAMAFGTGSLIMALPHFITDRYQSGDSIVKTCRYSQFPEACEEDGLPHYLYILILGQCLHGLGGAIMYNIGIVLIDDSVPATSSPLYLGILIGFALLGKGVGFILGGRFLDIYVDFERVHPDSVSITIDDPRWVGAWWLGFLISSCLFFLIALPLLAFGTELPAAGIVRKTRLNQEYKGDRTLHEVSESNDVSIRKLPAVLCRLLRNPTYVCITIGETSEMFLMSGFSTFLSKFVQLQFNLSAGFAAVLTGAITIPGSASGTFVGGLICRCMSLKVKGMTRFCFIGCLLQGICFSAIFLRCDQAKMAGINHPYSNRTNDGLSLTDQCNSGCSCRTEFYEPVCDSNGLRYFSSCYAGCSTTSIHGKMFSNCSCVAVQPGQNISMVSTVACQSNCNLVYVFLAILCVAVFFICTAAVPAESALLRCIHDEDRTFGMAARSLIVRMAGSVPGPILFGAVTDLACTLWNEKCGEKTSCWLYDNYAFAWYYFFLILGFKIGSSVFFLLAHLLYVPPRSDVLNGSGEEEMYKIGINQNSSATDNDDLDGNSIMSHQNSIQTRL